MPSCGGGIVQTYDGNGNLTYDGTYTYTYDAESRLTQIAQGATTIATYAYDAQGRRKSKTVGSVTTIYVTDANNNEVLEYSGTGGATQAWYAYGPGPNAVVNRMNVTAGTRQTMIPDIQGSIIGTLDSGGTLTKAGYQPFGENPTSYAGSFRYIGGRIDPETGGSASQPSGLYYLRARMYSPACGCFLQPDPTGYAGGTNLYTYGNNDPLNNVDPSGRIALVDNLIGAGIGLGIDFAAQYSKSYLSNTPFQYNYVQGATAAALGFATSGLSAAVGGRIVGEGITAFAGRAGANAVIGAGAGVTQTAILNNFDGQNGSYLVSGLAGGSLGAAGSVAGDLLAGVGSVPDVVPGNGISAGKANLINNILETSGASARTVSPGFVSGGSALGAAVGDLSSFSGK